jgi:hypothetical protein
MKPMKEKKLTSNFYFMPFMFFMVQRKKDGYEALY